MLEIMGYPKKVRKKRLLILIHILVILFSSTATIARSLSLPSTETEATTTPTATSSSSSSITTATESQATATTTNLLPKLLPPRSSLTSSSSSSSYQPSFSTIIASTLESSSASSSLPIVPQARSSSSSSSLPSSTSSLLISPSQSPLLSPPPSQTSSLSQTQTQNAARKPKKVCPGVHIRNDLKSFEQLRGCDIVDGPLTIALVSNQTYPFEPKDYENITFPQLTEITEYLLFFRVQGLSTLTKLFPNLSVIRGNELVSNYALIIYEMMHLQQIYLPSLADILRGSVRIESNPNLCYVSTVNWEGICKRAFTPHFIKDNNARCSKFCPDNCRPWNSTKSTNSGLTTRLQGDVKELGAENDRNSFCWTNQVCHELCQDSEGNALPKAPNGGCCSPQCAGGCFQENRPDQCVACRSVSQGDKCVEHCDLNLFEYKGRCVDEQACLEMIETLHLDQCSKRIESVSVSNLKPILSSGERYGKCQADCPPGSEEDPTNKHRCRPCDRGRCRKVCTPPQGSIKPFIVTDVNSLRELSGCNVINGSLEITMKGGKNVVHELETAFLELEEIMGYLKITRSYPILTLGFLRSLKAINGSELDRGQYSLIIIDNPNLQELFMFNQEDNITAQKVLQIADGKIFVHLNPKLCPQRIDNLKTYASVADWDERDVSIHTNGDKEACEIYRLDVQLEHGTSRMAMIKFQNYALLMNDSRSLLYYLINYREASVGTVTMFDGRDGCNSLNDKWLTLEEAPSKIYSTNPDEYQKVAIDVKPATRYALYVKTFTIFSGSTGAMSDIIYFETAPDTPGIPRQIESTAASHDSVIVNWLQPSKPNGIIERYFITITKIPELEDLQNLDTCDSIYNRDTITQSLTKEEPKRSNVVPSNLYSYSGISDNVTNNSNTCLKMSVDTDPDIQAEVVTFQDKIIDIVYLRQPCATSASSTTNKTVKRRSIDEYQFDSDNTSQNSVPRGSANSNQRQSHVENSHPQVEQQLPLSNNSIKSNSTQKSPFLIDFDRTRGKTEANITAYGLRADSRITYTINSLDHFSRYTIEVVACHGEFIGNKTKPSKSYNKCSLQAITQVRTLPIEDYDRVLKSTIVFHASNETDSRNIVTWKRPERPNGLVLAYRVHYKPKSSNSEVWTEGCINNTAFNRDRGFVLSDVNPGTYILSVHTISMYAGQRIWSEEIEFEIPQNYLVSPAILTALLLIGLCLLALVVASGTYYYQKMKHELVYASVNPDYIEYNPDEWEVDKINLIIGDKIGTGSFGMVYKGQLITEKGTFHCAVKTVPPTSTAKQRMDFLREASIMKQFDTFHVIKLLGVVSVTTPVYVIMEFMENGDLKDFLRNRREIYKKENKTLVDGIYLMAAQIADGMAYLASKKFVHRDLAARNCMVGENYIVKIGDFGLTRDVYANDYYRRDTQGRLPVRWMAPESLSDNLYTSASDVWSYGIVVWEMVTFSGSPYPGLSNDEVIKRVIGGFTMPRPDNCPDKLYNIMQMCWRKNDRDRPSFNQIIQHLLPEAEAKLFPNCFYRKPKTEGDNLAQSIPEENNVGTESYPLLSWPSQNNRANGMTNGVDHVNQSSDTDEKNQKF